MDIVQKHDILSANGDELNNIIVSESSKEVESKDTYNANKKSNRDSLISGIEIVFKNEPKNYQCKEIPCTDHNCEKCEWDAIKKTYTDAYETYIDNIPSSSTGGFHVQVDQTSDIVDYTSTNSRLKHKLPQYISIYMLSFLLIIVIILIVLSLTINPDFVLHV
ncbi:hypothetical protein NEIRO03_2368 [Nematocida sp. AWRm78]|nr:hypothetical protein NEIRO02_2255 [Nematocida sp. AWRm79]KAI5186731.1 hypothetical protein NEIRO03_2368 [Nematocida sp. AWRm78]